MLSGLFLSYHKGYTLRRTMEEASDFLGAFFVYPYQELLGERKEESHCDSSFHVK